MAIQAFAVSLSIVSLLAASTAGYAAPLCAADLSEIEEPVINGKIDGIEVNSIGVSFRPATLYIKTNEGTLAPKEVVLPSVFMKMDSGFLAPFILAKIRAVIGAAPVVGDFGIKHEESLTNQVFSNGLANSAGTVKIWKDWSMTGFKCKWAGWYLRCERTTWSVRLFQKTFDWSATTSLTTKIGSPEGAGLDPGVPTASRLAYDSVYDTGMNTTGKANINIKNDFEKAVLAFVAWFYSVIENDVWDRLSFSSLLPDLSFNKTRELDSRERLYPKDKSALYRDASKFVGKEGYRGFWYIFVDTLNFDPKQSGFKSDGMNYVQITYEQDNIRFAKRLTENNERMTALDPFGRRTFCRKTTPTRKSTRDQIADYLKDVVRQFEEQPTAEVFSGQLRSLNLRLGEKYGTSRIRPFLEKHGYIHVNSLGDYEGNLPSMSEIADKKGVLLPWEHAYGYSHYFSLSSSERGCILATLKRRHRSADIVLPFDDLSECLSSESVSSAQISILERIKFARAQHGEINDVSLEEIVNPVGNMTYAGWNYCYRSPRLCTGQNNLMWYQRASKFGARDGMQHGINLVGDDLLSSTNIRSIASGKIWFSDHDSAEWGNALVIPFELDGGSYYAVYAQLDSAAAELDQKMVVAGEMLGSTGCSGNAGNGLGTCNVRCRWSGALRTDEHLHFEVIADQAGKFEHVDPLQFLPTTPASDERLVYVYCEN